MKPSAWVTLDVVYFDAARRQVELYEDDVATRPEFQDAARQLYWGTALAGACIAMVCAAMEGHANYLIGHSARGQFANLLRISEAEANAKCDTLPHDGKWRYASTLIIGRQVFSARRPPFRDLRKAIWRRNRFISHPKLVPQTLPEGVTSLDELDFEELREVTILNAKAAIAAGQAVVRLFYAAMEVRPPDWAVQ